MCALQQQRHVQMNSASNSGLLNRGTGTPVVESIHTRPLNPYPTHFGNVPAQGPWNNFQPQTLLEMSEDHRHGSMNAPPPSPTPWRTTSNRAEPNLTSNGDTRSGMTPSGCADRTEQNRKRAASREFQKPYLKEMAIAHAQNREPAIQIPVCASGTVLGLKSPGTVQPVFVPAPC